MSCKDLDTSRQVYEAQPLGGAHTENVEVHSARRIALQEDAKRS